MIETITTTAVSQITIERQRDIYLHLQPDHATYEELPALLESWQEELNVQFSFVASKDECYATLRLETRKQFSLVPYIIRKAERVGWRVGVTSRTYSEKYKPTGGLCNTTETRYEDIDFFGLVGPEHADFWKLLALGQMWYEK